MTLLPVLMAGNIAWAQLEEIVVTAQKREQNLQDVPINVTALSGSELQAQNWLNPMETSQYIPGVAIFDSVTGTRPTIRGLGTPGGNIAFEQSVSTFVDGVYYGRSTQLQTAYLDPERIEILRGPQPLFAGQNAIAGAVNITTVSPNTEQNEGYVFGRIGSDDEYTIEGAYNVAVSDSFAIRGSFKYQEQGGWIESANGNGSGPDTKDTGGRIGIAWEPNDRLSIVAKVDVFDFEAKNQGNEIGGNCDNNGDGVWDPTTSGGLGENANGLPIGANPGARLFGITSVEGFTLCGLQLAAGVSADDFNADTRDSTLVNGGGLPANALGPYALIPVGPPFGIIAALADGSAVISPRTGEPVFESGDRSSRDGTNASFNLGYEFENFDLAWVAGYSDTSNLTNGDIDGTNLLFFNPEFGEDYEQFNSEVRLFGENETLDWMVGLYWQDSTLKNESTSYFSTVNLPSSGARFNEDQEWVSAFAAFTWHVSESIDP